MEFSHFCKPILVSTTDESKHKAVTDLFALDSLVKMIYLKLCSTMVPNCKLEPVRDVNEYFLKMAFDCLGNFLLTSTPFSEQRCVLPLPWPYNIFGISLLHFHLLNCSRNERAAIDLLSLLGKHLQRRPQDYQAPQRLRKITKSVFGFKWNAKATDKKLFSFVSICFATSFHFLRLVVKTF